MLAMILWASSFIALKLAFRTYHPMVVIFGRLAVASICFMLFIRQFKATRYRSGDWKPILFMAFCEPCLYFLFEAKALEQTTASQAGMISALLPLMVAVAARIFLKETITLRTLSGFIMAIVGAIWMSVGGTASEDAPNPALGNFFEFIAMMCAVGYIITLKRLTERYSPFLMTAFQAVVGSFFYFPILFLPSTVLPTQFDLGGTIAVVYLGAFISFGAYGLYNLGLSRVPASHASAFINLIPVFTVIFGWLILNERFSPHQYYAALLILIGIFYSQGLSLRPAMQFLLKPRLR
jgi:drug/metabolite transporter (DMT)-like permease